MRHRQLGKTGYQVSEIGIGCWQFGGDFGPIEDATSAAILGAAQEGGVSFYDTADVYGAGRSERVIGAFANDASNQDKPKIIATKVGRMPALYPDNYARDDVRRHIKDSLSRLNVASLDLVQLHCIPPEILRDGRIFQVMDEMQSDGLIKAWARLSKPLKRRKSALRKKGVLACKSSLIYFAKMPLGLYLNKHSKRMWG